ncbi:MAG: phospho-N-acetylmuramoyl-pentapeptide-transferase, partial [Sporomusaceae bacterium]|nr:phospho-N-acetylmuramoyl-pentapeptide-transferase [Sporomusaceae bacterium]
MQELLYASGMAFVIALVIGPLVIPVLRRFRFGQSIRQEGPERHYAKAGTPTMGGIIILIALVVPVLVYGGKGNEIWLALFITLGHG